MLVPADASLESSPFLRSYSRMGAAVPALNLCKPDSPISPRSLAHPGLPALAIRPAHLGVLVSLQSPSQADFVVLLVGLARLGPCLSALERVTVESSPFTRSFARIELPLLALRASASGSSPSLRCPSRSGAAALLCGTARTSSSFLASDCGHTASIPSIRSLARVDLAVFPLSRAHSEPPLPVRSSARLDSVAPVMGFCHIGLSPSARAFACPGLAVSLCGLGCLGLATLASDRSSLGPFPPSRSMARAGFAVLVLGSNSTDFSVPLRSSAQSGPLVSVPRFADLGSPALLHALSRAGLLVPASSISRLGFSLLVLGPSHIGSSISLRSLAWSGPAAFASRAGGLGSFLPLRSFARIESFVSCLGEVRLGSGSSAVGCSHLETFSSPHSFARMDFVVLVLRATGLGSLVLLRSFGHLGSAPLALNFGHAGPSLLSRELVHADFSVSASGMSWCDSSSLAPDLLFPEPSTLLKSTAQLESLTPASCAHHLGMPTLLRSST